MEKTGLLSTVFYKISGQDFIWNRYILQRPRHDPFLQRGNAVCQFLEMDRDVTVVDVQTKGPVLLVQVSNKILESKFLEVCRKNA